MQIAKVEVTPVDLHLRRPILMANIPEIENVLAVFVRLILVNGQSAWGCTVAHPDLTGDDPQSVLDACRACAEIIPDLHPLNVEYLLGELSPLVCDAPTALCAFDLAFYDLLGLVSGLPLYRLLGGFRNRIQTSATIPIVPVQDSVTLAQALAKQGFRMLKVKGGVDPDLDVHRVKAIHRSLPEHVLRLDPDGAYSVQTAIEISRALEGIIQILEQPTPADDLEALRQVRQQSPVLVFADQSAAGPASVLELASRKVVDGVSVKIGCCGGLRCAAQVDAIARAAGMVTMVSCLIEPSLMIAAGLSFALSSPNVHYSDLDGHLDLNNDPSLPGFKLEEGWLVAGDVPGLGCIVNLG